MRRDGGSWRSWIRNGVDRTRPIAQAVLKKLSPFTVSVYQYQKKQLEKARALFPVCGGCALALAEEFYDAEVGLKAE